MFLSSLLDALRHCKVEDLHSSGKGIGFGHKMKDGDGDTGREGGREGEREREEEGGGR